MKRKLLTAAVAFAAGYARHMYLTGYIAGRNDLVKEMDKMQRMRAQRPVRR